jgi:hypothetical protein
VRRLGEQQPPNKSQGGNHARHIDSKRLIWPGLAGLHQSILPYSYAIIGFAAGAVVVYHGFAKLVLGFAPYVAKNILMPMGFPIPTAWAYLLGIVELFGGIALALGLFVRPLALFFAIQMLFVISCIQVMAISSAPRTVAGSSRCCCSGSMWRPSSAAPAASN